VKKRLRKSDRLGVVADWRSIVYTIGIQLREGEMKFISVRDFRSKSGKVWGDLAREKDLLLTSNGKPIALVSAVSEEDVEESLAALRQVRAMTAVERMQSRSVDKGTSKMTLKEINAEISTVRKERKG
jgi:hypothetical protein